MILIVLTNNEEMRLTFSTQYTKYILYSITGAGKTRVPCTLPRLGGHVYPCLIAAAPQAAGKLLKRQRETLIKVYLRLKSNARLFLPENFQF
jgi:hypothetical protein